MKTGLAVDKEKGALIAFKYNKHFENGTYEIYYNTKTGFELIQGINNNPDPVILELPSLLDVGIMGSCPNHCEFCYQGNKTEPHMTFENFRRIIDETKHHVNQVALGGRGDPNLHPDFRRIVEYARSNGVVPNYTTSGVGLTDLQVDVSKACGAVAVSDYRSAESYRAINSFINSGIKTNIHFMLTKTSYFDAVRVLQGGNPWQNLVPRFDPFPLEKINAIIFLLFKPQGNAKQLEWFPNKTQLRSFADLIVGKPNSKTKIGMDSCLVNYIKQYIENLPGTLEMVIDTCEAARASMYITPSMEAMPCSFADSKFKVSLEDKTIKEAWDLSQSFKTFRKCLEKNPKKCPLF
jgi:MoaA/NifB/PqqE/SkfB family radical SAM enzyme